MCRIMIVVCIETTCNKIPVFNYPGTISGMYCATHKLDGMINVKKRIVFTKLVINIQFLTILESFQVYTVQHINLME